MDKTHSEAAAAAIVERRRAVSNLEELHARLELCFARVEPFEQAGKYVAALMGDVPRKNGWQIAEYVGDATPDRTQRLLNHAVWDHQEAMAVVRAFVVEQFGDQPLRVAAVDESGQEKAGSATVGVQRQYLGCAGRIANGINAVYCSYATPAGHALVHGRIYVPQDQLCDPDRRAVMGIPDDVVFKTKPELAIEITGDMLADGTMPDWAAADEVYGRCGKFRNHLERHGIGYVVRVGKVFGVELATGVKLRRPSSQQTPRQQAVVADPWRPGFEGRTPLRLGMAGNHQTTTLSADSSAWTPGSWPTTTATSHPADQSACRP